MKRIGIVIAVGIVACGPGLKPNGGGDDGPDVDASTYDSGACIAEATTASEVTRPVDILWVIDNSGSMSEEETRVQNNMNSFVQSIANSGVDYHVVVITDTSSVNVPPPLGGSPRYLGVDQFVNSNDPLERLHAAYPMYKSFLRTSSIKHIVVVTDDESDWSKPMFESQLAALTGPGFGTDWKLHAVVAEAPPFDFNSHCFTLSAEVGATYIALQQAHGGVFFSLCDTNWSPLFTTLAQTVSQGLQLPCSFAVPTPPMGQALDPMKVNFVYTPTGGAATTIVNVGSAAGCNGGPGWYYDDPTNPTQIITCPATCSALEGDPTGSVSVEYGCSTQIL